MSAPQLRKSIRDIIPTFGGACPEKVFSFAESLYLLSLKKKPILAKKAEITRYHLCSYLAIERYQKAYSLPEPSIRNIPLQPHMTDKVLNEFREALLNDGRSAGSTPTTSPSKRNGTPIYPETPSTSPVRIRSMHTPSKVGSPLRKMQSMGMVNESSKSNLSLRDVDSPFNPKSSTQSPAKSSPSQQKYIKRYVTVPELISFANCFYIPAGVTAELITSFVHHRRKFLKKNEWLLACGMIYATYIRINHSLLQRRVGAKSQLQNQLFQYQKGGLMKQDMLLWCNVIDSALQSEKWITELNLKYVWGHSSSSEDIKIREVNAKLGAGWKLFEKLGRMPHPSMNFSSESQTTYFKTWKQRALDQLQQV